MVDMPPSHEIVFQPDGKRGRFPDTVYKLESTGWVKGRIHTR